MVDRHTIDKIPLENGGIVIISTVHLDSSNNDGRQERYVTFAFKDLPIQYTEKKAGRLLSLLSLLLLLLLLLLFDQHNDDDY